VNAAEGEVFDLGYRGYDGERRGPWSRRRAIWRDGIRISLGLGRGLGAKVTSWILLGLALVPIVVLVVISAFLSPVQEARGDFNLPSYADYFNWAHIPLGLFAAVVAPLLLCPDRREGVLSLYAARPITPTDYVGSRWAAFLTVTALAGWLPLLVLFTWNTLDASSPWTFLADNWEILPRLLAAGATVALALTTLALFVSSFATRRAYAAVGILAVFFVGSAVGGIAEQNFTGPVADALSLLSVPQALIDSVHWLFSDPVAADRPLPGWASLLWLAVLTAALGFGLVRRTERLVRG
jgi:ABC-2 type transport system permease protein